MSNIISQKTDGVECTAFFKQGVIECSEKILQNNLSYVGQLATRFDMAGDVNDKEDVKSMG